MRGPFFKDFFYLYRDYMHPLLSYAFIRPLRVLSGHVFFSLKWKKDLPQLCNPTPPLPSLPLRPPPSSLLLGLYVYKTKKKAGYVPYGFTSVDLYWGRNIPSLPPCVVKHRVFALHNTVHKIKSVRLHFALIKPMMQDRGQSFFPIFPIRLEFLGFRSLCLAQCQR